MHLVLFKFQYQRLKQRFKNISIFSLCLLYCFQSVAWADNYQILRDAKATSVRRPTLMPVKEYFFENFEGEYLVPIELLGAVQNPGLYHLPKKTDLARLLALSGGLNENADLSDIKIKRWADGRSETIRVSLDDNMEIQDSHLPTLEANDRVYIARKEPWISQNTVTVIAVAGSVLSIVVSAIVIDNQLKK